MICLTIEDQRIHLKPLLANHNAAYVQMHQLTADFIGAEAENNCAVLYIHFDCQGTEAKFRLATLSRHSDSYTFALALRANQEIAVSKEGSGRINLLVTLLDEKLQLIPPQIVETIPERAQAKPIFPVPVQNAGKPDIASVLACLKNSAEKIQNKIEKHFPGRPMKLAEFVLRKKSKKFKKK